MAGCFEFRMRSTSFDLHQLATHNKLAKLGRMFRSRSEGSMKKSSSNGNSPADSPMGSPMGSPKSRRTRRFVRVVRDNEAAGEEYENPHIIRRYSSKYWEKEQKQCLDDSSRPLPYTVSGHTILKKHSSFDIPEDSVSPSSTPNRQLHASFKEEVEVIEFHKKDKITDHQKCKTLRESIHSPDSMDGECVVISEGEEDVFRTSSPAADEKDDKDSKDQVDSAKDSASECSCDMSLGSDAESSDSELLPSKKSKFSKHLVVADEFDMITSGKLAQVHIQQVDQHTALAAES